VLDDAIGNADSKIVWLYPQRPVIAAIQSDTTRKMDLGKPATPKQLLRTIKNMGLISNILTPVTVHSLRNGSAQDVAHLPRVAHAGFTDNSVRQTMGHDNRSLFLGTTESYVGAPTRLTYNDRAANQFEHRWGAKFSEESALDFVNRPISQDEVAQWLKKHDPETTNKRASDRARIAIRAERHQEYISNAPRDKTSASSRESAVPISFPKPISGAETSSIDPRLLDEDELDNVQVGQANLDALCDQLLPTNKPSGDDDANEEIGGGSSAALEALLAGDLPEDQQLQRNQYNFITHFSKINIVNCTRFADNWAKHHNQGADYADSIAKYSVKGNSRDSPTPMLFHCQATSACPYSSIQKKAVVAHEALCTPEYVARERCRIDHGEDFKCDQCEETFLTQHLLKMHIKSIHTFVPKPCPQGCEPEEIYAAETTLNQHIRRVHSGGMALSLLVSRMYR
jgi:hypothetical protein